MLTQYSIVCQVPGAAPYTLCPYSGTDLSQVLGITQADMPEGYYGWIQECGEVIIRGTSQMQSAYADFSPNAAKRHLSEESSKSSQRRPAEPPSGAMDEASFDYHKNERLSQLPPLLIEAGPYCKLLREARDVFVDGHFYACVAMCGISFERFQRDEARPYGATRQHKMPRVRKILQEKKVLKVETLALCRMGSGHGKHLIYEEESLSYPSKMGLY